MRPRRRNRSSRRGADKHTGTYLKFGAAIAIVVALGAAVYFKTVGDADRAENYCSKSKQPGSIVVLAVDASDPFDRVQAVSIDNKIREAVGTLKRGDRLDIYEVNAAQGGLATRTMSMCNPGDPTSFEKFSNNQSDDETNYKRNFETSVAHALKAAEGKQTATESPILESLRSIAPSSFPPEAKGAQKRIIIISDLIQNSPTYSMFKSGSGNFDSFKKSPEYAHAAADFSSVSFDLLIVLRAQYARHQTRSLLNWWEQYISDNDGTVLGYKRI